MYMNSSTIEEVLSSRDEIYIIYYDDIAPELKNMLFVEMHGGGTAVICNFALPAHVTAKISI